jgi:hypothetical protein
MQKSKMLDLMLLTFLPEFRIQAMSQGRLRFKYSSKLVDKYARDSAPLRGRADAQQHSQPPSRQSVINEPIMKSTAPVTSTIDKLFKALAVSPRIIASLRP